MAPQIRQVKQELSLPELIDAIAAGRWNIIIFTASLTALALIYILLSTNIYRADALIQLDTQLENRPPREGSLSEASAEFDTRPTTTAELSIIESRTVLGDVVDALPLGLVARPAQPPLIGPLANRFASLFNAPSRHIAVETFSVPSSHEDIPFTLVAQEDGEYTLFDHQGEMIANGSVGKELKAEMADGSLALLVTALEAPADTEFDLLRKSRTRTIEELQRELTAKEEGKESGMIRISMEGRDRELIMTVVAAVAESYIKRQKEWRSQAIKDTLSFLEEQAPILADNTRKAERSLRTFRSNNRAVNLSSDTERLLDRSVELQVRIADKVRERHTYLPSHPTAVALTADIDAMERELEEVDIRVSNLPRLQQKYLDLSRTADINAELYASVMQNIQELQLIKSASSHDIRLIDSGDATAAPVKPRKALILTVAVALGLFLGAVGTVVRRLWRGELTGPNGVEELLGIPVYTSLPFTLQRRALAAPPQGHRPTQLLTHPDAANTAVRSIGPNSVFPGLSRPVIQPVLCDIAVEGFRSLRTWINTSSFKRTSNVLLITGASQEVGKTFVSVNLAATLAAAGRRVLLIDGDLRKGNVHRYFGIDEIPGLSDIISGKVKDFAKVVHEVGITPFDLMPTGSPELCHPELLLNERFAQILELASQRYDEVIVDSPPILAVSDASVIGQHVGGTLLVVREDVNTAAELIEAYKRLENAGVTLRGVVYNGFKGDLTRYAYYGSQEQRAC